MAINKEHKEFHALDMSSGWETPAGYPAGIQQKILSGALDEKNKRGSRSRLLRFAPGVYTTKPFVHEYWEEVYLVSGDLTVGNDEAGRAASPSRRTPMLPGRPAPGTARSSPKRAACCSKSTISIRRELRARAYFSLSSPALSGRSSKRQRCKQPDIITRFCPQPRIAGAGSPGQAGR